MNCCSLEPLAVRSGRLPDSALTQAEFDADEPVRCGQFVGLEIEASNFRGTVQVPLSFVDPESFPSFYW